MKLKLNILDNNYNVFFSSDAHFNHEKILKFEQTRDFTSVEEMNQLLIDNWNSVVSKKDIVIYNGDFNFKNWRLGKEIADKLNGKIHYILGNHDTYNDIKKMERFESINDYIDLSIVYEYDETIKEKIRQHICLMHYPIFSWNRKKHGSWMLHGHSHGRVHNNMEFFYNENKILDISLDNQNLYPISFQEVLKYMNKKFG